MKNSLSLALASLAPTLSLDSRTAAAYNPMHPSSGRVPPGPGLRTGDGLIQARHRCNNAKRNVPHSGPREEARRRFQMMPKPLRDQVRKERASRV